MPSQEFYIAGPAVLVVAIAVWFFGAKVNTNIPWLERLSIPVVVTGGFLFSAALMVTHSTLGISVAFDLELRDLLLVTFFASIGLSAKVSTLIGGGAKLALLILVTGVFLVAQSLTGVTLASAFGVAPEYGLFAGSISLAGGHGTAIAWGQVAEQNGLVAAKEVGLAFATFGLVAGGLIGGPIAEHLVRRHKLTPAAAEIAVSPAKPKQNGPIPLPLLSEALGTLLALAVCVQGAEMLNAYLEANGITIPKFLCAMLSGIVLGNLLEFLGRPVHSVALESAAELSLQLFLVMSLMSVQLWVLSGALNMILLALLVQTALATAFATYVVFHVMGRNYDAAIVSAGFAGLGMGATPVGIANMNAVTEKHGPSPKAFLIIPLIGAFFLDIMNAFVIKGFLAMPFISQ